jgi:predicted amidohydrolase
MTDGLPDGISTDDDILWVLGKAPESVNRQSPLYYAVQLLRALRKSERAYYESFGQRPDRESRLEIIDQLQPTIELAFGNGSYVRSVVLDQIREWLSTNAGIPVLIKARLIARAIEEKYGIDFRTQQLQRYYLESVDPDDPTSHRVLPGDPIPVCESIFGVGVTAEARKIGTTSPRSLPRWRAPDRLRHILLAPPWADRVDLRLNFGLAEDMREIDRSPIRVATVHPASDLESDFDWDTDEDALHVWNVRPKHSRVVDRLLLGMRAAATAGARVVVLPELCCTEADQNAIRETWASMVGPSLLVAGSFHCEPSDSAGSWQNVCQVHGRSGTVVNVTKIVPYARGQAIEKIAFNSHPRVEIFWSDRVTMMVFICVDFLLDTLRDIARDLDVSLVFIPSMSQKSQVFHGLIDGHVAATQAAAVFANVLKSDDEKSRGYVASPVMPSSGVMVNTAFGVPENDDTAGVAVFDFDDPSRSQWIDL